MKVWKSILFVALSWQLSACNSHDTDAGSKSGNPAVTINNPEPPGLSIKQSPDTNTWPSLLDRTTGASYSAGSIACAKLTKSYRKDENTVEDVIVVNLSDNKDSFMGYRYIVPLTTQAPVKEQLAHLANAGYLEAEASTHEGAPAITYKLTQKGWGELPLNGGYSHSLCYETGKWKINKILDYELMDSQGSGLEAYMVKFEIDYVSKDWVTDKAMQSFKMKHQLPKQSQAILIKGPNGYFNPVPARNHGLFQNTVMPTPEEGTKITKSSKDFISNLCLLDKHIKNSRDPHNLTSPCPEETLKTIRDSLVVYNVGIPSGGNMTVFKFGFKNTDGTDRFGRGSFNYSSDGNWLVDSSFSMISE